ncbi:MAG: DNA gyrase subunit A [Candidatus Scalindua sp.]|jgi:DNA gyrase subunit A|nr:DNA gyrase subunit A [Candidatus Scalindua sp.]MBT5306842.1 DNA gyrase subunit A [Candidatus Scalindua sp.]MBT6230905.1 DNA gyrase subunit A [Candidatus Scalindua sp.]MBT6564213.1 DNA gyrase subunit A [Candidatus Scalindua sp.]MBT7212321.1 DNA gyrase subunit A [Candidatus Scalindua sp.]
MIEEKGNIKDILIEEEMKESYLTFAMSVIMSRALPDVRDGLKPSQRRILVAMNDLNLSPGAKFRKCAKICGDTTGNYHPHGEQVVYPTLVRMAQDWSLRYTLVRGQGNFGSIDGDPPAAMRYTEAKMTHASSEMMEDIKQDTVDYIPNYDDTRTEPSVLPAKFPNILCNGGSGIAVGMATSIPPHNVNEVCDGIVKVIDNPDVTIDELLTVIKGPDFPTGALICGVRGIEDGYKTGRGIITVRAKSHIETAKNNKQSIVVTEIPYQLNRDRIIERIAELVRSEVLKGITDIRNESDREGSRIVIVLKRNEEAEVVLNQLYKHTSLQNSFSIIMIALVDGRPETLNLKQLLNAYVIHRKEIIRRRTRFLLNRAEERAHILEGLRIALENIDEVIKLIKASKNVDDARISLVSRFSLSERQANAILEMRLQRLTNLEQAKLEEEYQKVCENIREYKAILENENLVLDIIREDLHEIKEKYGDERKTEIIGDIGEFNMEDLISEEDVTVIITHEGYIKRLPITTYRKQHRGGKGVTGAGMKEGDFVENLFIASTHDYILFFTDMGKVYWLKVYDIPNASRIAKGRAIVNLLELDKDENVTSTIPVRKFDDRQLVMATRNGIIKKTVLSAFGRPKKGGIISILLDSGDKLIGVKLTTGGQEIVLGTENGKAIRFSEDDVRCMGRATRGVKGIGLKGDDKVKGIVVVDKNATLLTVCENGFGKRTDYSEYSVQRRSGQGVINIKTSERNGKVVALMNVSDDNELMMMTAKGMIIRAAINTIRSIGRNTQGVTLISLKAGDKVVSVAPVIGVDEEEAEETETDETGPQQPEQSE